MPRLARSILPIARALSYPSTSSITRPSSLKPLRNLSTIQTPLVYISQSLSSLSISTPSRATSLARLPTSSLSTSPLTHFVRYKTLGTFYQPSQRRRKRKHGFLSRIKTHNGRKMIKRRALKGRRFLSH